MTPEINWFRVRVPRDMGVKLSLLDAEGWPEPFTRKGTTLPVNRAYSYQGWLRRCLKYRSGAVAAVPWTLRRGRGGDLLYDSDSDEDVPDEVAYMDDFFRLAFLVDASMALKAQAYVFPQFTNGSVDLLQYLSPFTVKPQWKRGVGITHYRREVDGVFAGNIDVDDLVALFDLDPFTEAGPPNGSDGEAARVHAAVLDELAGFAERHLRKGLIRAHAVMAEDSETELPAKGTTGYNRMMRAVRRVLGGKSQDTAIDVFQHLIFKPIGEGLQGLANVSLTTEQRQAVAFSLGLTYGLVSPDAPNKATLKIEKQQFAETVLRPQCTLIAQGMNRQFFRQRDLYFQFEVKRLEGLQEDQLEEVDKVILMLDRGIISRERAAEILGEDPDAVPDEPPAEEPPALPEPQRAWGGEGLDAPRERLKAQEIAAYRRKVKRRGIDAKFEATHAYDEILAITKRLHSGESVEDAFEPPFVNP